MAIVIGHVMVTTNAKRKGPTKSIRQLDILYNPIGCHKEEIWRRIKYCTNLAQQIKKCHITPKNAQTLYKNV
eukprot:13283619-Ditylum_brightwellii.AAC.1